MFGAYQLPPQRGPTWPAPITVPSRQPKFGCSAVSTINQAARLDEHQLGSPHRGRRASGQCCGRCRRSFRASLVSECRPHSREQPTTAAEERQNVGDSSHSSSELVNQPVSARARISALDHVRSPTAARKAGTRPRTPGSRTPRATRFKAHRRDNSHPGGRRPRQGSECDALSSLPLFIQQALKRHQPRHANGDLRRRRRSRTASKCQGRAQRRPPPSRPSVLRARSLAHLAFSASPGVSAQT